MRCALTETRNAYAPMPARTKDLATLAGRLADVRAANLEHHAALVRAAAAAGARVVGLGELFAGPYFALGREPLWRELAEDALDGPTARAMRAVARAAGVVLVCPLYELDPASGKRFNAAIVIDEDGDVLGRYRKTHVPSGANERASFCEDYYYEPSDGELGDWPANVSTNRWFPVFETAFGRIGVAICYDRHFAGVVATLASQGAELVLSPAVTFGEKSRRMWRCEFATDAMRHRVFIGGSNRRGAEPPWNVEYFGESAFVGPDGPVAPLDVHPELVVADLDLASLAGADPSGWDLRRDARPGIYDATGGTGF